ncbi:hypothetical protein [Paraburkholderia sp. MM6662-R1]|uniref:hypothetical protein n=1 Tax=Paraburkholderia sp. MM6662-R1 TaxID=2991066 RepID=UPI003D262B58
MSQDQLKVQTARPRIDLRSPWDGASAWATILEDGCIQLELCDHSEQAEATFGNDVTWDYTIPFAEKPKLIERLAKLTGRAVVGDEAILTSFAETFKHVHAIRDWLKQEKISFEESFDSWA